MFHSISIKKILERWRYSHKKIHHYNFTIHDKHQRKHTQSKISNLIKKYKIRGTHHEFVRAIGNGLAHGKAPVKCKIFITEDHRMLMIITDNGIGFDYEKTMKLFREHKVYYHHKGFGFKCYNINKRLWVDWGKQGKQIKLYYH